MKFDRNALINMAGPVNWLHPLNRRLVGWWMVATGISGGSRLMNLCRLGDKDGFHGTLTNAPTWSGNAPPGGFGSVSFAGSTRYCSISGIPINQTGVPLCTVSAWVNADGASSDTSSVIRTIYAQWNETDSQDHIALRWLNRADSKTLTWGYYSSDGGGSPVSTTFVIALDGLGWQHIVGVANQTNLILYRNGVQISSGAGTGPYKGAATDARIGGGSFGGASADHFPGLIAGVRTFNNYALSAAEVAQLYHESRLSYPNTLHRLSNIRYSNFTFSVGSKQKRVSYFDILKYFYGPAGAASGAINADGTINIEYIAYYNADNSTNIEYLLNLYPDNTINIENLLTLHSNDTTSNEYLLGLVNDQTKNLEHLLVLHSETLNNLEYVLNLSLDNSIPYESTAVGGISADGLINLENITQLIQDNNTNIESLINLAGEREIPYEWLLTTAFNPDLSIEYSGGFRLDGNANLEFTLNLSGDSSIPLSFLLQLDGNNQIVLEYSGGVNGLNDVSYESILQFLSNNSIGIEHNLSLGVEHGVYCEFLRELGLEGVLHIERGLNGVFSTIITTEHVVPIEIYNRLNPGFFRWVLENRAAIYVMKQRDETYKVQTRNNTYIIED